jgi:large subunit ribosomal protein L15
MDITHITTAAGAHKRRKRVGRGESSGHGKTSGRGNKGQKARAGGKRVRLGEGAMFPLFRRLPKFGFNNALFRKEYQVVNVADLNERFKDNGHVTAASLEEAGLIRDQAAPVKVLGDGELQKKLTVAAHRFSASAVTKIESVGGTVTWLGPKPKKKFVARPKVVEKPAEGEAAAAGGGEKPAGEKPSKEKPAKEKPAKAKSKEGKKPDAEGESA